MPAVVYTYYIQYENILTLYILPFISSPPHLRPLPTITLALSKHNNPNPLSIR